MSKPSVAKPLRELIKNLREKTRGCPTHLLKNVYSWDDLIIFINVIGAISDNSKTILTAYEVNLLKTFLPEDSIVWNFVQEIR